MEKMISDIQKMTLNIQLFAEEGEASETDTSVQETAQDEAQTTQEPTFTDLLKNPNYQREFDRLVNKSLNTAKSKWEADYSKKLEAEKSEAEKLAQMDADQKMQYELNKANAEKEQLQSQLNAINLYKKASEIAGDKDLPIGYLDLIDFRNETAESITEKIDKIEQLRQRDLQSYLKEKLKQPAPQEKADNFTKIDPYVEGFLSEN